MDGLGWRFMRAQIPRILLQPFEEVDGKPEVGFEKLSYNYFILTIHQNASKENDNMTKGLPALGIQYARPFELKLE